MIKYHCLAYGCALLVFLHASSSAALVVFQGQFLPSFYVSVLGKGSDSARRKIIYSCE